MNRIYIWNVSAHPEYLRFHFRINKIAFFQHIPVHFCFEYPAIYVRFTDKADILVSPLSYMI